MRRTTWRWAVPVAAAGAVAVVTAIPRAAAASAHPALPPRSAASLLAAVESSDVKAISGTVQTTANLGLPQLPGGDSGLGAGWAALLTGTHQLRVWADGRDRQRVALLGDLAETDVIHDGTQLWTWSSARQSVTHQTLPPAPAGPSGSAGADTSSAAEQLTPQAQADKALKAIDPTTAVTVDRTARVAGRAAYQLVLTPRTTATLIRSVRIAIDAAHSVPLRVQIFAAGGTKPAFQTGFTSVSFRHPAGSVFRFTPPANARTTGPTDATPSTHAPESRQPGADHSRPATVGSGWATVLELPAGTIDLSAKPQATQRRGGASVPALLREMTAAAPQGRLLTTRLLSALITPDGRVLLGAVPPATLERVAG